MRYQDRIYIENKHTGPRNRAYPNVSLSSDLCVFTAPSFVVSGATKIGSLSGNVSDMPTIIEGECGCPTDYVLDIDGVRCVKTTISNAVFNGSQGSLITSGNTNTGYSIAAYFFPEIDLKHTAFPLRFIDDTTYYGKLKDANLNIISSVTQSNNTFWGNPNADLVSGRLNNIGLMAYQNEWVGFTTCINITTGGTYYFGIAADNFCKFSIDTTVIFDTGDVDILDSNFNIWSVFPVNLQPGSYTIHMEGKDAGIVSSFGAEIYYPSSFEALTGATNPTEAGVIFSTASKIGSHYDMGETIGYTCSAPYILSNCDGGTYKCIYTEYTQCSGTTTSIIDPIIPRGVFITDPEGEIPVSFDFTGNTDSFTATPVSFSYEIYKYNSDREIFVKPPVLTSNKISYSAFQQTNIFSDYVPVSGLTLDGEYLVKGYYQFDVCTDFLKRLGKKVNTLDYSKNGEYQLYDKNLDYYFVALSKAQTPIFVSSNNINSGDISASTSSSTALIQEVIPVDSDIPISMLPINFDFQGEFILTLNGLILANDLDYTYDPTTITLSGDVTSKDLITVIYSKFGNVGLTSDSIHINSIIPSGDTGTHGSSNYFYNTTTSKYEVYCTLTPLDGYAIIVTINAVTLASGVDFYQSTTDPKRIILNGNLLIGDVINIFYYPSAEVINSVTNANNIIAWSLNSAPTTNDGYFTLELSNKNTFDTLIYSASTQYEKGVSIYHSLLQVSGNTGITLYYRVKNSKNYTTLTNNIITTTAFSDVMSIKITSNSVNSY